MILPRTQIEALILIVRRVEDVVRTGPAEFEAAGIDRLRSQRADEPEGELLQPGPGLPA